MPCLGCLLNRKRQYKPTYYKPPVNQICVYTKEDLINFNKIYNNNWLTSQINIYDNGCNRFERQVTAFLKSKGAI